MHVLSLNVLIFSERVLQDDERPLEIMQEWGPEQGEVKFLLRYTVLPAKQSGMSISLLKLKSVLKETVGALVPRPLPFLNFSENTFFYKEYPTGASDGIQVVYDDRY